MRAISKDEVVWLHDTLIEEFGGKAGVLNLEGISAATDGVFQTFDGRDLYPSLVERAAMLAFILIKGHYFLDGNKRTGFAAMVTFLELNGKRFDAEWYEAEDIVVRLAAGDVSREAWCDWISLVVRRSS